MGWYMAYLKCFEWFAINFRQNNFSPPDHIVIARRKFVVRMRRRTVVVFVAARDDHIASMVIEMWCDGLLCSVCNPKTKIVYRNSSKIFITICGSREEAENKKRHASNERKERERKKIREIAHAQINRLNAQHICIKWMVTHSHRMTPKRRIYIDVVSFAILWIVARTLFSNSTNNSMKDFLLLFSISAINCGFL